MDNFEPYERLWNRALWYLGRRDYGTGELRQKLLRPRPNKPLPNEDDLDRAIERLVELNLLDDERYAQRLAESYARKGYGQRGIDQQLYRRGLKEEAPELTQDDPERLAELLQTPAFQRKLADPDKHKSLFAALLRRGFRHGDIRTAMRDYLADELDCDD
ncbi:MAG: recombination regulator RecX [Oscillospiraceae bacterium]|nr:recombination regulator RecX [Oscillospiraceae bacterium]